MDYRLTEIEISLLAQLFDLKEIRRIKLKIGAEARTFLRKISKGLVYREGFTWGNTVWIDNGADRIYDWVRDQAVYGVPPALRWLPTVAHEMRHTVQYRVWTKIGFLLSYIGLWGWDWLTTMKPNLYNRFEREARDTEEKMQAILIAKYRLRQ